MYRALQYIRYLLIAKGIHRAHSAFIFDLFEEVLNEKKSFYCFEALEERRKKFRDSTEILEVEDFGAGSVYSNTKMRSVRSIALSALKRPKYARLLFRLIEHLKYKEVLELGTSLGITTAYLGFAVGDGKVETIEGSKSIYDLARMSCEEIGTTNITFHHSSFKKQLPSILERKVFDVIFIDGHHQGAALLDYVNLTKSHLREGGCFIIDDINWSKDMHSAWERLIAYDDFSLSLDFFEMGILFKRSGMVKQNHVLRY